MRLPARDKLAHLAAWYWLRRFGSALGRRPLPVVLKDVKACSGRIVGARSSSGPEGLCAAVRRCAGRLMPRYTCLPQALAGYVLCRRRGYPVRLRLGVLRRTEGELLAHAWLEYRGDVVLGDLPRLGEFTAFDRAEELVL